MSAIKALSSAPPLERQTLGDQVYAHVRKLLMSGRLAPGDKLSLRSVADVMGVSMMPVREAVSRLVADRALEVTPNRAVRVPEMKRRQFQDLRIPRQQNHLLDAGRAHQDAVERVAVKCVKCQTALDMFCRHGQPMGTSAGDMLAQRMAAKHEPPTLLLGENFPQR